MCTSDARNDRSAAELRPVDFSRRAQPGSAGFLAGVGVGVSATLSVGALIPIFLVGFVILASRGVASDRMAASVSAQEDATYVGATDQRLRPIGDIRRDAKAFIKRSKDDDPVAATGAIVDLCILHYEIVHDPRFETHDQLVSLRAQIATRLKRYRDALALDLKRHERSQLRESRQAARAAENRGGTRTVTNSADASETARSNTSGDTSLLTGADSNESDVQDTLTDAMIHDAEMLTSMTGGPVRIWGHVGGNFAPPWDHGPELVNLIESTINPDFWRRNGGNGVIEYYQPLRILVISASSQVHDDITNMLRLFRETSR